MFVMPWFEGDIKIKLCKNMDFENIFTKINNNVNLKIV